MQLETEMHDVYSSGLGICLAKAPHEWVSIFLGFYHKTPINKTHNCYKFTEHLCPMLTYVISLSDKGTYRIVVTLVKLFNFFLIASSL